MQRKGKMGKKRAFLLTSIAVFSVLTVYVGAQYVLLYDSLYKVDIRIGRVKIDELSDTRAHVTVSLNITNPGIASVTVSQLQWDVFLNGLRVGTSAINLEQQVLSGQTYVSSRGFDMTYHLQALLQARDNRQWKWRITGSATFQTPLLMMQTPIYEELDLSNSTL